VPTTANGVIGTSNGSTTGFSWWLARRLTAQDYAVARAGWHGIWSWADRIQVCVDLPCLVTEQCGLWGLETL